MENEKKTLNCWDIVELMGHQRIAGHLSERNVAGTQMLQVDVPAIGERPAYSRLLGGSAIYAINPCDEAVAREWAASISDSASPLTSWDGVRLLDKMVERKLQSLPEAGAVRECANCHNAAQPGKELCSSCDEDGIALEELEP